MSQRPPTGYNDAKVQPDRRGGLMLVGCLFIFGSLWAAVMTASAFG